MIIILGFAIVKLLLHFLANSNYGIHADELYYIALSKHLQWGYYDIGPFITWMAKLSEIFFGRSIFDWRILPSIFSACTLALTGELTRRLGGGTFAITVACTAMLCSPAITATGYMLQPAVFDQFFGTAIAYCVVCYNKDKKQTYIYLAAGLLGLGILNKISILLYNGVWVLVIKLTRKNLIAILLSGFLLALILSPYVYWQYRNGFPVFEYMDIVTNRQIYKNIGDYLFQLTFFHGAAMAVWLAGLVYLLMDRTTFLRYRVIGIGFIILIPVLYFASGKLYYILGAFPVLMTAGGICWEKMLERAAHLKFLLIGVLISVAMIALPIVLPILPFKLMNTYVRLMVSYAKISQPLRWDDGHEHEIPQYFADMVGWEMLSDKVKAISGNFSFVYTTSYAAGGAITYYQPKAGITVAADNNSFMQWAPSDLPEKVVYISREKRHEAKKLGAKVDLVASITNKMTTAHQLNVYILQQPSLLFKSRYKYNRNKIQNDDQKSDPALFNDNSVFIDVLKHYDVNKN